MNLEEKQKELERIAQEVEKCQRCPLHQQSRKPRLLIVDECFPASQVKLGERSANSFAVKLAEKIPRALPVELHKRATRGVPGEGNPDARIMFIGEGPGYYEDQKGIPFCGAAGRILDELLQLIKLERKEVFIGNVVKHRPPENRDPLPLEIEACRLWLDKQIAIIKPEMIVTLGRFSLGKFLPEARISRVHGQPQKIKFQGREIVLVPMYHPAAGLRRGEILEDLKKDFLALANLLTTPKTIEPSREQLTLV